mgnify:CR=1 FL=1
MLVANYEFKKDLKQAVGQPLHYTETSLFGQEYILNGRLCVVGPSAYRRKWYANVLMENGLIKDVI